jgi:small multidrug resistance family-3 protein
MRSTVPALSRWVSMSSKHKGLWWIAAGVIALVAYGFVGTFQPDPHFGRILAGYGGVFVAGHWPGASSSTGSVPTATTFIGAIICLVGVAVVMYAPSGT